MVALKCSNYGPLYPIIFTHFSIWESTLGTFPSPLMKRIVTTSSAPDMSPFSGKVSHRSSAFSHFFSRCKYHVGGGDIITTLSPLTTIVPRSLD